MTELMAALRLNGPRSTAVCVEAIGAICNLAKDQVYRVFFVDAGVCEGSVVHYIHVDYILT